MAVMFFFCRSGVHSVVLVLHFHQVEVLILYHGKIIVATKSSDLHHSSEIFEALEDITDVGKTVNNRILFDIEAILIDRVENETNVAKVTTGLEEIQRWLVILIVNIHFALEDEKDTWADTVKCYKAVLVGSIWFQAKRRKYQS